MIRRRDVLALAAMAATPSLRGIAAPAQIFPWKPVTIVQPYGPGNQLDVYARKLAPIVAEGLGQPVIVDTHAGASGNIASGIVARAAPDGHTLLVHGVGTVLQSMIPGTRAPDPLRDLAPIARFTQEAMVVTVHPRLGVHSIGELVALARSEPGRLPYGTSGVGGIQHLGTLLFAQQAGIELLHVPFPNSSQIYSSLLSGEVPLAFAFSGSVDAYLKAGRMIALAVTTPRRISLMANVPTLAESGYPDYAVTAWSALSTTGGTPATAIERIRAELATALGRPEVVEMFVNSGTQPGVTSTVEFRADIASQLARWGPVMRTLSAPPRT